MRRVWLAVSLLATWASVALVAQYRFLPTAPGTWKPWQFYAYADDRRVFGARPADVKDVEAQLLRLNAIVKQTEGFTNPVGFSIETAGNLSLVSGRMSAIAGEPALTVRPLPSDWASGPTPSWNMAAAPRPSASTREKFEHLWFSVNDLPQPLFAVTDHAVPEFEKLDVDVVRLAKTESPIFQGLVFSGGPS